MMLVIGMILVTIRVSVIVVFVIMVVTMVIVIMVVVIPFFLLLAAGGEGWRGCEYLRLEFLALKDFLFALFAFVEEGEPDAYLIEKNHRHGQEGERGDIWGGGDQGGDHHNGENGIRACVAHDLVVEHP